jgi:hypothetical protein
MKKNLQEGQFVPIPQVEVTGQLLQSLDTPFTKADGKPDLNHKLRVVMSIMDTDGNRIGQYQKEITIKEKELNRIMNSDLVDRIKQENKKMTLKEMIKQELISMLNEGMAGSAPEFDTRNPDAALAQGAIDSEKDKDLINQMEELEKALNQGSEIDTRLLQKLLDDVKKKLGLPTGMGEENINEGDSADNGSQTSEKTLAKARAQGERHGKAERQGTKIKLHSYAKKDVQAAYLDGYKKGKAAKLPYAEGRRRRSVTDGMPVLQGTAKQIDDLIGAAIDAHMKADRFAERGAPMLAAAEDLRVRARLAEIEPLMAEMPSLANEFTLPHLAAAKSSTGEERLAALGKAKDALVPR